MLDTITKLVTILVALSLASERLVGIVRSVWPWLNKPQPTRRVAWQGVVQQAVAVGAGMLTAFLAEEVLPAEMHGWKHLVVLGLLASGGSGFWKSVLEYVVSVKDIARAKSAGRHLANATTAYNLALTHAAPLRQAATSRAASGPAPAPTPTADVVDVAARNLRRAIEQAGAPLQPTPYF